MSAVFTFRPSLNGWLVKTGSSVVERDVSAVVGREVHVEDFPSNIAVVGHVAVGNKWVVILKPAGRAEFVGALLQRQEYGAFDPFKVVAELEGGQEIALAIETAVSLSDSSTDAVVQQPRTPHDMFLLDGLSSYLPLAYAAFIRSPTSERRKNYWSYLPRRFALAAYPLARFGELATREFYPSAKSGDPSPYLVASPVRPIGADPVRAAQTVPPDVALALARLARLEEQVETLAKGKQSLPPRSQRSNGANHSALDNALKEIKGRLDNLEARPLVKTVESAGNTSLLPRYDTTSDKRRLLYWIAGGVASIVASATTACLLILLIEPDMLMHVEQAKGAATRAEISAGRSKDAAEASAKIQLEVNGKTAQVTEAGQKAEMSISLAATNAADAVTGRVAKAGEDALTAIAGARSSATAAATEDVRDAGKKAASEVAAAQSTLTKAHGVMIACMTSIAKAEIELAKAKTATQHETATASLVEAVTQAEGKCLPKP